MQKSLTNNFDNHNKIEFRAGKFIGKCEVRNIINDLRISSSERRADM